MSVLVVVSVLVVEIMGVGAGLDLPGCGGLKNDLKDFLNFFFGKKK